MPQVPPFRLYIDESGDHTYKHLEDLSRRYLGLTGVLISKAHYDPVVPRELERLKRQFFSYDPDIPPILTRKDIIYRKGVFRVLLNAEISARWDEALLAFLRDFLQAQIFTVVIDKQEHFERFPVGAWNPYGYSLSVLLNRVRGFLNLAHATADIMPESRGEVEDNKLLASYVELRESGATYGAGEDYQATFPVGRLLVRRKDQNVAGLQIADLLAAEQKALTTQEVGKPMPREIAAFGQRINEAIAPKVNQYGRYLLE